MKTKHKSKKAFKRKKALPKVSTLQELGSTYSVSPRKAKGFQEIGVPVRKARSLRSQEDFPLEQTGWLEKNPDALALVDTGIRQAKEGKVKRMSFAEYADLEIDD